MHNSSFRRKESVHCNTEKHDGMNQRNQRALAIIEYPKLIHGSKFSLADQAWIPV